MAGENHPNYTCNVILSPKCSFFFFTCSAESSETDRFTNMFVSKWIFEVKSFTKKSYDTYSCYYLRACELTVVCGCGISYKVGVFTTFDSIFRPNRRRDENFSGLCYNTSYIEVLVRRSKTDGFIDNCFRTMN